MEPADEPRKYLVDMKARAHVELDRVARGVGDPERLHYLIEQIAEALRSGGPFEVRDSVPLGEVVAGRIREYRKLAGWTQQELATVAAEVGLKWSRQTVAEVENEYRKVSIGELVIVAALFGVPMVALLVPGEWDVHVGVGAGAPVFEHELLELLIGPDGDGREVGSDWEAAQSLLGPGHSHLAADIERRRGRPEKES